MAALKIFINLWKRAFPGIEKNYGPRLPILVGHSLCGMFSVYTLFNHSELFILPGNHPWLLTIISAVN